MLVLKLFDLCKDLIVLFGVFELGTSDCPDIVKLGREGFLGSLDLVNLLSQLLVKSLSGHTLIICLLMKLLLLRLDLH